MGIGDDDPRADGGGHDAEQGAENLAGDGARKDPAAAFGILPGKGKILPRGIVEREDKLHPVLLFHIAPFGRGPELAEQSVQDRAAPAEGIQFLSIHRQTDPQIAVLFLNADGVRHGLSEAFPINQQDLFQRETEGETEPVLNPGPLHFSTGLIHGLSDILFRQRSCELHALFPSSRRCAVT